MQVLDVEVYDQIGAAAWEGVNMVVQLLAQS